MYRSDPRYWCYILARDFEVVWNKLFTYQVWFEDTNMIHKGLYTTLRRLWLFWSQCRRRWRPLCSHSAHPTLLLLHFWVGSGGGGQISNCAALPSKSEGKPLPHRPAYMQWFNWNYWPVVSNLRGQSASDWHITPVVFRDPPCSFSLGELLYVLLLAFIIASPTFTDRLSWTQTCFLHSALL